MKRIEIPVGTLDVATMSAGYADGIHFVIRLVREGKRFLKPRKHGARLRALPTCSKENCRPWSRTMLKQGRVSRPERLQNRM